MRSEFCRQVVARFTAQRGVVLRFKTGLVRGVENPPDSRRIQCSRVTTPEADRMNVERICNRDLLDSPIIIITEVHIIETFASEITSSAFSFKNFFIFF